MAGKGIGIEWLLFLLGAVICYYLVYFDCDEGDPGFLSHLNYFDAGHSRPWKFQHYLSSSSSFDGTGENGEPNNRDEEDLVCVPLCTDPLTSLLAFSSQFLPWEDSTIDKIVSKHRFSLGELAEVRDYAGIVNALEENPSLVNSRDKWGKTALYYFAKYNEVDWMGILIRRNANVNLPSITGSTPLMVAADSNAVNAVKLLLAMNANPFIKNCKGQAALDFAKDSIIRKLILDAMDGNLTFCTNDEEIYNFSIKKPFPNGKQREYLKKLQKCQMNNSDRLMTYNIRYGGPNDESLIDWERRKQEISSTIQFHRPDIIAMQEVLFNQFLDLNELLYEYICISGNGRDGNQEGEHLPICFKKHEYQLLEKDTFWLSKNPKTPGSLGWDAKTTRIVSWIKLLNLETEKPLAVFNVHLDHEGPKSRVEGVKMIINFTSRLNQTFENGMDMYIMGDMNDEVGSASYQQLLADGKFTDSFSSEASFHYGNKDSFPGFFDEVEPKLIDFIFYSTIQPDLKVLQTAVVPNVWNRLTGHASDHHAVAVDFFREDVACSEA